MNRSGVEAGWPAGFKRAVAMVLPATLLTFALAGCGGAAQGCEQCGTTEQPETPGSVDEQAVSGGVAVPVPAAPVTSAKPSRQEASRFLTQATFGPTPAEVDHLVAVGYQAWLDEQFAAPMAAVSHVAAWDAANAAMMKIDAGARASTGEVTSSFWRQAVTSPDQLRQRVAFALSEIFVVSMADFCGDSAYSRGVADYLDMLGRQAFGNYRDLLQSVSLHPVMGCYLSHLKNQKEDLDSGRVPDENFAREIMQLFSIGLYQLKPDGTLQTDAQQQPIDTYSAADISGLARVFTGWSWWCAQGATSAGCFFSNPSQAAQYVTAMRGFELYHSTSEKRFLGAVVPASIFATPQSSLKVALDTLSAHPNVGPFIGKQLIQRLVTSNPSPAYVARVSAAFKASGGSLRAMVSAILLDPEARDMAALNSSTFGKVREPILRFSALLRAFDARSASGMYLITTTADSGYSLGQSALAAPSVFNFFRPGYAKPGSQSALAGLVTPELQIATETSAAGYVNFMRQFIASGAGRNGLDNKAVRPDVQLDYNVSANSPWLAMADAPTTLVNEIDQRLMYGSMPAALKSEITQTVTALDFRAQPTPTAAQVTDTRTRRLWAALLLTVASPEFQVQK